MTEIILRTPRLILSTLSLEDAPFILEILNEPAFLRFIGDRGVRNLEDAENYLLKGPLSSYELNEFGLWRVQLAATGESIGICGLIKREGLPDVDLGYAYLERFWSQGYATESALGVRDYARQRLGLRKLLGITDQVNTASIRVLEKIGMRSQGLVTLQGEEHALNLFGMEL